MNKAKQRAYNFIEDTMNQMWKEGTLVRSSNPDTKTGEYYYTLPHKAKAATKSNPELGSYLTYQEFQSSLN
jgi:hypothetical protein